MRRGSILIAALVGCLAFAGPACADDWLPHPADASWVYEWTDSVYNSVPTKEKVTVKEQKGAAFSLAWTTEGQENPGEAPISVGTVSFQDTTFGLNVTNWSSNPPPSSFPILCGSAAGCGNSLASAYYNVIWGNRSPLLVGPLLRGAAWASTGGAEGDVSSGSTYLGLELVTVPAFPAPVLAANFNVPNAQIIGLGRPLSGGAANVSVNLVAPGDLYGDRSNQLDVRFAKVLTYGRTRTNVGVDLYNALNASPATTYNQTFGPRWLTPTQIMPARFVKFSMTLDF